MNERVHACGFVLQTGMGVNAYDDPTIVVVGVVAKIYVERSEVRFYLERQSLFEMTPNDKKNPASTKIHCMCTPNLPTTHSF